MKHNDIIPSQPNEIIKTYNLKPAELALARDLIPISIIQSDLFLLEALEKIKVYKNKAKEILLTKSENIITKLKEIKDKAIKANDTQSIDDIDWIMASINDQNLYEIDSKEINSKIQTDTNKSGFAYLAQYSKIEDANQKAKDFKAIRRGTKTFKSLANFGVINGSSLFKKVPGDSNTNEENKKEELLELLTSPEFDVFALDDIEKEKSSITVAMNILSTLDIIAKGIINNDLITKFITKVSQGYSRINAIYHNDLHAADVMQTVHTIFIHGNLQIKMKLEELDRFGMLIGAFCHDLNHTGQNNTYHMNSRSKLATRYNDVSVLENFHIASTFKIINDPQYDILKPLKPEEYRIMRRRIIEAILSTDMANHQKCLSAIKAKIEIYQINQGQNFEKIFNVENDKLFDAQQTVLNMCLHCADISNPAKPDIISEKWTQRVYDEFFLQGDLEKKKGLPVSLLCDRETTVINKAMIGFISFVVAPSIDILVNLIPEIRFYSIYIGQNLKKYEANLKKEEKKK